MELIGKLPLEVIRENIMPFTYKPQPRRLLEDIISYYKVKHLLYEFYNCKFHDWVETQIPFGSSKEKIKEFHLRYSKEQHKYIENLLFDDVYYFSLEFDFLEFNCIRLFYYSENGHFKKIYDKNHPQTDSDEETYHALRAKKSREIFDYINNPLVLFGLLKPFHRFHLLQYITNEAKKDDRYQYQPFMSLYLRDIYDYMDKSAYSDKRSFSDE